MSRCLIQKFLIALSPSRRREPWRRSRLIQVGEMAKAVPGLVRAGRPRSREAVIVRAGRPRSREAFIP